MIDTLMKKEYFAAMAMQGLLANPENKSISESFLCLMAVRLSEELFRKLREADGYLDDRSRDRE